MCRATGDFLVAYTKKRRRGVCKPLHATRCRSVLVAYMENTVAPCSRDAKLAGFEYTRRSAGFAWCTIRTEHRRSHSRALAALPARVDRNPVVSPNEETTKPTSQPCTRICKWGQCTLYGPASAWFPGLLLLWSLLHASHRIKRGPAVCLRLLKGKPS